jgi:septation ring formation regulator EzrA
MVSGPKSQNDFVNYRLDMVDKRLEFMERSIMTINDNVAKLMEKVVENKKEKEKTREEKIEEEQVVSTPVPTNCKKNAGSTKDLDTGLLSFSRRRTIL